MSRRKRQSEIIAVSPAEVERAERAVEILGEAMAGDSIDLRDHQAARAWWIDQEQFNQD